MGIICAYLIFWNFLHFWASNEHILLWRRVRSAPCPPPSWHSEGPSGAHETWGQVLTLGLGFSLSPCNFRATEKTPYFGPWILHEGCFLAHFWESRNLHFSAVYTLIYLFNKLFFPLFYCLNFKIKNVIDNKIVHIYEAVCDVPFHVYII